MAGFDRMVKSKYIQDSVELLDEDYDNWEEEEFLTQYYNKRLKQREKQKRIRDIEWDDG
jgi:hypothetical protein